MVQLQSQLETLAKEKLEVEKKLTEKRRNCRFLEGELQRMVKGESEREIASLKQGHLLFSPILDSLADFFPLVSGALFVKHGRESSDLRRLTVTEDLSRIVWAPAGLFLFFFTNYTHFLFAEVESNSVPLWELLTDNRGLVLPKVNEKRVNVVHVEKVEPGTDYFPGGKLSTDTRGNHPLASIMAKKQLHATETLNQSQCFSIVFKKESGIPNLNLQIPLGGNGRSRDEWISAFKNILHEKQQGSGNGRGTGIGVWKQSIAEILKKS